MLAFLKKHLADRAADDASGSYSDLTRTRRYLKLSPALITNIETTGLPT